GHPGTGGGGLRGAVRVRPRRPGARGAGGWRAGSRTARCRGARVHRHQPSRRERTRRSDCLRQPRHGQQLRWRRRLCGAGQPLMAFPGPRHERGIGLIEVMVAVAILAFGMLAIAALQATALRNSQSSLERSQAVMKTYAILDAMRANRDVAMIGGYNMGNIDAAGTVTAWACGRPDPGDLSANDRRQWVGAPGEDGSVKAMLGESACTAIRCGDDECIVALRWNDARGTGGDAEQELVTRTGL